MTVREEAEEDIASSVLWYAAHHQAERIPRFLAAIDDCFAFILRSPQAAPRIERGYHQFPLRAFPYFVVYRVEGHEVVVLRVFHMRRDPKTKLRGRK
ncbi:MAG: type II toxin-antitoxin system RelE/ParE family toxin [Flavobacteriales bacterium]|nr:type II toxin-antitoxin system RelE/ParE family toxin [Flavobacteriales bacterium]